MHFVTFQRHVQKKKIFKPARIRKKYIILFPGIYNVSGIFYQNLESCWLEANIKLKRKNGS